MQQGGRCLVILCPIGDCDSFCSLVLPNLWSNGVEFDLDFLLRVVEELGNLCLGSLDLLPDLPESVTCLLSCIDTFVNANMPT